MSDEHSSEVEKEPCSQQDAPRVHEAQVLEPGSGSWFIARSGEGFFNIRHVVPGDRVLLAPRPDDPEWADLLDIISSSPHRVEAACPHTADCGGCHWPAIAPNEQSRLLMQSLRRTLERIGHDANGVRSEIMRSPTHTAFRYRARFQLSRHARGFHRPGARTTVDIDRCRVLAEPLQRAWSNFRSFLDEVSGDHAGRFGIDELSGVEITTLPEASGALLYLNPRDAAPSRWRRLAERALADDGPFVGVAVRRNPGDGDEALLGRAMITGKTPAGRTLAAVARGFLQSNLAGADLLLDAVLDAAGRGRRCLELYSGCGLIGHALARAGLHVRAVEANGLAVRAATAIAPPPSARGSYDANEGEALAEINAQRDLGDFDLLLADPPRQGLERVADRIATHGPRRVVLVHCSVRGLERDLHRLLGDGYRLERSILIELFPHTRFFEHVACLRREDPSQ